MEPADLHLENTPKTVYFCLVATMHSGIYLLYSREILHKRELFHVVSSREEMFHVERQFMYLDGMILHENVQCSTILLIFH